MAEALPGKAGAGKREVSWNGLPLLKDRFKRCRWHEKIKIVDLPSIQNYLFEQEIIYGKTGNL
jgi:hypothetical protein